MDALKQAYAVADKFLDRDSLGEIHAIWDDHDYGRNDGGGDYPLKKQSEALFLDFWKVPTNDVRRQREGIYYATFHQIGDIKIQMIFLDTRYFRSKLKKSPLKFTKRFTQYMPTQDKEATLLGDAQWLWLEQELAKSADIRIIASSIQVLASNHGWEKWSNFPAERKKLLMALKTRKGGDILLISGDRHFSALYEMPGASINSKNSLLEFTSSSLNNSWKGAKETDTLMVEEPFGRLGSYGKITLYPEKRLYHSSESPMTEAGINGRLDRDLYVSLGNMVSENKWSIRVYDKPLIRLIWIGTIFMILGAIISIRFRKSRHYD